MSQRKNYFIEKGMQSKFIVTLLLLIFLVAVITICNVYIIYEYVQNNMQAGTANRSFFAVAFDLMGYRLLLIGLVNILIVAIIGVFYSHQFAGPSYKIERSIRQIAQGDLSFHVTLRKSDAMHNIAESINQLVNNYRNVLTKAALLTSQIKETSAKLASEDEAVAKEVAGLRGIAGELEDLLAGIKLTPTETPASDAETAVPGSPAPVAEGARADQARPPAGSV
jgi:methyl-accepting chemotaxis protein